jgi:hypothetical protein
MGIQKDKLSEEQKKEIERLRNFVARNRLNTRMNGTKWRAAIDAVCAIAGYQAAFRVKLVTEKTDPPVDVWDAAFPDHIPLYNSIEWLELHPASADRVDAKQKRRTDFRAALRDSLIAAGIPIQETDTGVRIVGYSRT